MSFSRLSALLALSLGATGLMATPSDDASSTRFETKVRSGQTLSEIFDSQGFGPSVMMRVLRSSEQAWRLERLRPGHRLALVADDDGGLEQVVLQTDPENIFRFTRNDDGKYETEHEIIALERRRTTAQGVIDTSLYAAAMRAGMSNRVIHSLAGVFEWDVDLRLDLRRGDRFSVVYEELYLNGKKVRDGEILAAELVNSGKVLRAVRYQDPSGRVGYFTPEGLSVQKAFFRSPVEFARMTSGFSLSRRHPVLHTVRAHRGVDYAAPIGTPIRATGDGRVRFIGRKGGFGRTIVLSHGGQYTTLYAHMSRYASRLRRGSQVRQGQTIGYIGMSGLASGPHVHYEFRVNGVHQNSRTVELPSGESVPEKLRGHFVAQTRSLSDQLAQLAALQLASAN